MMRQHSGRGKAERWDTGTARVWRVCRGRYIRGDGDDELDVLETPVKPAGLCGVGERFWRRFEHQVDEEGLAMEPVAPSLHPRHG